MNIFSYSVKRNPIGSAVIEILWFRQKDKQTDILLLYCKDCLISEKLSYASCGHWYAYSNIIKHFFNIGVGILFYINGYIITWMLH